MIERRFVKGAEVRAKAGDKPGIEGYAAVYGEEYVLYEDPSLRMVETIKPGAFSRALKEKQDVRCLFNHDPDNVLGRTTNKTLTLSEDKKGLSYDADLDMRTTIATNVSAFVDRGDVTGCSFAFTVRKQVWREETINKITTYSREIEDVDLHDVGPVTYPAYEGTSVGARALEQRFRDIGIPKEMRSRIELMRAMRKASDNECNCRCVACDKGKCENCADHMVKCGDEDNCRCMDNRSKRSSVGADSQCRCACAECQVGNCAGCSDDNCEDPNCNEDNDRTAQLLSEAQMHERLRLAGD